MYQDIHLSDKQRWNEIQSDWANGAYSSMLTKLQNVNLAEKVIDADMFSSICDAILALENQYFDDVEFKKNLIKVSTTPPSGLSTGQVYFKIN